MAQRRPWEVEDGLWELIEPLLPRPQRRFRNPGRRRLDDRRALWGILFVLYTGIAWEFLHQELGYGPGMTCPATVYAGRACDHDRYRDQVRAQGITPHIARRGQAHGSGPGVCRWVVEQAIALPHWFRRLRIRWEIRDDIHEAFLSIACSIICWRDLDPV